MGSGTKCKCERCKISGLMGPAILITLGGMLLLHQMGWRYGFWDLWPVILVVIGAIKLAESLSSNEGHLS